MPGGPVKTLPGIVYPGSYDYDFKYAGAGSYYSFNSGLVHFICLNTYHTTGDDQKIFLENDLKKIDRSVTPWVFVFMHGPMYHTNEAHQNEVATNDLRDWAEPLMLQYKVDACFAGHVHAYERSYGVKYGELDEENGIVYVVAGGAFN